MNRVITLIAALTLSACSGGDDGDGIANSSVTPPPVNVTSETPGDWSQLATLIGRTPSENGLLVNSPVMVDLNALVGPDIDTYRKAMAPAGKLHGEGRLLVSLSPKGEAYLVLDPAQHSLEAGMKKATGWQVWRTPAAEIPRPESVRRMLAA